MGGRNSKQKKYEVSEENVISDEDSSDDDFIEDNNFINAPNNKYKIKATKLLQKFKEFKYMYGERMIRDKILSPRTLFREIFEKRPENYTDADILVLESYMELRLKEWEREDNAATKFQKVWRGRHGRKQTYEMKEKIRKEKVAIRMEYFLECADRRREEHHLIAMSNEVLKQELVQQEHLKDGIPWLKHKSDNHVINNIKHHKKREREDRRDHELRQRAIDFFIRQTYLRTWIIWDKYTVNCRKNKMSSALYLKHNFRQWFRKCNKRKNIDKMLQRIWDKMYLGFQRVYFNVWWRRVRKNYTVVRPKNSKYTVLIESRDLIFPTIEKKVLLDYSAYNDNIDGRQENEITTIPILYDNNNDNVTTSTSKYSKPALDDDFIKEFDTWLNSNEVRRKYQ